MTTKREILETLKHKDLAILVQHFFIFSLVYSASHVIAVFFLMRWLCEFLVVDSSALLAVAVVS